MKPALIIVGASIRAAAASAIVAGYDVYGADLFGDHDTRQITTAMRQVRPWPAALAAAIADYPQLPWLYTGALENQPAIVERLARQRPLLGNSAETLRQVRNPQRIAATLAEAGLPFAETSTLRPLMALEEWLAKPLRGAGGARIGRADCSTTTEGFYWQRTVDGQAASATYVAAAGQARLLGTSWQLIGMPEFGAAGFTYAGSICPGPDPTDELERLGNVLAARFGLTGLFGVDGIYHDGQFVPVEINPRYTASVEVIEAVAGCSLLAQHVAACQAGTLPAAPASQPGMPAGKAILFAKETVQIDQTWLQAQARDADCRLADLPSPGEVIAQGRPILSILADGQDNAEVRQRLEQIAGRVYESLAAMATG